VTIESLHHPLTPNPSQMIRSCIYFNRLLRNHRSNRFPLLKPSSSSVSKVKEHKRYYHAPIPPEVKVFNLSGQRAFEQGNNTYSTKSSFIIPIDYLYPKGSFKESDHYFTKALELLKGGKQHTREYSFDLATTMHNLGVVKMKLKKYEEAEKLLNEAYYLKIETYGKDDPHTIGTCMERVETALNLNRYNEALALCDRCIDGIKVNLSSLEKDAQENGVELLKSQVLYVPDWLLFLILSF